MKGVCGMEEQHNKKYSIFCMVSFIFVMEAILLTVLKALNFIDITESGQTLSLNICIISFVFGLIRNNFF